MILATTTSRWRCDRRHRSPTVVSASGVRWIRSEELSSVPRIFLRDFHPAGIANPADFRDWSSESSWNSRPGASRSSPRFPGRLWLKRKDPGTSQRSRNSKVWYCSLSLRSILFRITIFLVATKAMHSKVRKRGRGALSSAGEFIYLRNNTLRRDPPSMKQSSSRRGEREHFLIPLQQHFRPWPVHWLLGISGHGGENSGIDWQFMWTTVWSGVEADPSSAPHYFFAQWIPSIYFLLS